MDKRALLVGSSFSAAPLFFALKRRGLHVTVCGNLESDPCHQYADASSFFDYSNKDLLLDYVEKERFDYIIPSCNDFAYLASTWVASKLGYPGFDELETALTMHTKHRFREFCDTHAIPQPLRIFHGLPSDLKPEELELDFPLLVKPVDSFSGRGVTKAHSNAELSSAVQEAGRESRTGEFVVEKFHDGSLHSHSAYVEDGTIVWDGFVDEFCTAHPYQVDCSYFPSTLSGELCARVRESMSHLITAAKLNDGLLHTQFIVSGEDFWIIETMRRSPGDLYGKLVEDATGLDYTDMYVAKFLGEKYRQSEAASYKAKFIGRHTISVSSPVVTSGFHTDIAKRNFSFIPLKGSGERLDIAPYDKLGILFVEFENAAEMLDTVPRFTELVKPISLEDRYG